MDSFVIPHLTPIPRNILERSFLYQPSIKRTIHEWNDYFDITNNRLRNIGHSTDPQTFIQWLNRFRHEIIELPDHIIRQANLVLPVQTPYPEHPRSKTNEHLFQKYTVTVPPELPG